MKALIGMYGKSGGGKTLTALYVARGLVGPTGRITLIDSENGRGSIYADIVPGGYNTLALDAPFSPMRYEDAIVAAEAVSDVVVIDSLSHEWSGEGGVLDWADAELEKMGGGDNNKMRSWIKPKMAHKMMIQRLLRTKCALICCLRGEEKTHLTKPDPGQKAKVVTDEFSTTLFDPRFIFEMLLNFEVVAHNGEGGYAIPRKITHPSIKAILPKENEQMGEAFGAALAKWCLSAGAPATGKTVDPIKALKTQLWNATVKVHGNDASRKPELVQWLVDESIINPDETLETLTADRLKTVIEKATAKLANK